MAGGFFYSRWTALSAALIIASFAGTGYAIGLFTQMFKTRLGLDQSQVDRVASAGILASSSAALPVYSTTSAVRKSP